MKQLLADLSRLDLGFVHWSGVALEEFANVRAQPDAVLTIDFSEIFRYIHITRSTHFADGMALLSFAIAVLRKVGQQPLYLLPGTLFELRGYLESRRDEFSDRDGVLRRIAKSETQAEDLLLRRHALLQRLARLLSEEVIIPWYGTMPELSEDKIRFVLDPLSRAAPAPPIVENYVDARNLAMVKELRRDRPVAHVTASAKLHNLKDELMTARHAESPFPLLLHPAQLALVKASRETGFPKTEVYDAARKLLTSAPSLLQRWTDDLRHGIPPSFEALRAFGEALGRSRALITAFFAWITREEKADLFDDTAQELPSDQDFDHVYDEIVTTIDRLLSYVGSRR